MHATPSYSISKTMALCNSKSPTHFHIQQSQSVLFLNSYKLTIFIFVLFPFAKSISFEFSNFQPSGQLITYEGDAVAANSVIELTNASGSSGSVGRASYKDPVQLWDSNTRNLTDFSTSFSFIITPSDEYSTSGDGLTFFLCPYDDPIPANTLGGYLGLLNLTTNNKFVAVEFDTYQDSWDLSPYHTGIDVNDITSKTYCNSSVIMANGTTANARVAYNSTTQTLSVSLSYDEFQTSDKLFHVIDLRKFLPEWVRVGFSAALDNGTERHTIASWTFNSTFGDSSTPSNSTSGSPPSNSTPSNSTPGSPPSKTNQHLGVYLPVGIGFSIFGVGLFLFITKKRPQVQHQDQGESQGGSHETNSNATTVGSTSAGGDVKLEGSGINYGNTYYTHYQQMLSPAREEMSLLKVQEAVEEAAVEA